VAEAACRVNFLRHFYAGLARMRAMTPRESVAERFSERQKLALSVLACSLTALVAAPLSGLLDLANMVMPFLLTVLLVAVSLGRNPAVLAAVLSVVLFDVFFVPPRFSLAVSNLQYLITFAVMLATALITAHLAASLKEKARDAERREQRTRALYEIAGKLAGALNLTQVAEIVEGFVAGELRAASALQIDETEAAMPSWFDVSLASRARETRGCIAGTGECPVYYLPLAAPMRVRGILAIRLAVDSPLPAAENRALMEALASLVAIAVERLHYVEVAQSSELRMATERLRSSILSALSHDLRTPLTVLVGLADSLFLSRPQLPAAALETAGTLREQAGRLAGLVTNLLEMARLHAGSVNLRREWQPIDEVIGSSLKLLNGALGQHHLRVDLQPELPLLYFDAVLVERVLCNLLENAAKYSPPGGEIVVMAQLAGSTVEVAVGDRGPGFAEGGNQQLFEMFVRGERESDKPGTGLGLAICHAIVEAHGGSIRIEQRSGGGALVVFALPRGEPPVVEPELP
jgi:two-component system sensor histidine kinase KdpD